MVVQEGRDIIDLVVDNDPAVVLAAVKRLNVISQDDTERKEDNWKVRPHQDKMLTSELWEATWETEK